MKFGYILKALSASKGFRDSDLCGLALMAFNECFMHCVSCTASLKRDTTWARGMASVNCLLRKHRDVSSVPSTKVKPRHNQRYL